MDLVVLLGLSTGTTAPEISSLWRDRARPAQVGYPVNFGGHIARKTALFFKLHKPAVDRKGFLRCQLHQASSPGRQQGNQGTPSR